MSIKSESSPARRSTTSGFRHDRARRISIPSARVRRPSLARAFRRGVGFLSLETISLPGRQRSHDYNAIQRIDAESWGHTRGRRRVANPRRVRPARRRKKNTLPPPPIPPPPPLTRALTLYRLVVGESIYDLRATSPSPICTKSLTSLLVIFSA